MDKFHIKKISEVNKEKLHQFYQNSFDYEKPVLEDYKWRYRSELNEFEPLVLTINNEICGHAGLIPIKLKINNKIKKAIWFTDFFIKTEHRSRGYGRKLTEEWMKICPIQITLCNDKSLKVFKKLDWSSNNNFTRNIKFYNYLNIIPVFRNLKNSSQIQHNLENLKLEESNNKTLEKIIDFNENNMTKKIVNIVRDENWFKWRIIDCPYKKDIFIFNENGNFLITHIKKRNNLKILNIIYSTHPINANIFELFLNFARKNHIDYLSYISNEKKISNIFLPWQRKINFAFYAKEKTTSILLSKELDDIQFIDSDIDYV
ncbi:GNAT family N-acetyltransferase [Candidatus Pelagibacter bacterium]|nr:GNAT family N-acetyltransferase [Candidatus Pelagibacter bacterium]